MTGFFGAGGMGGNVERDMPGGTVDFTKPVRIKDKPELDVRVVDTTYIADQAMRAFVLVVITGEDGNDQAALWDENGKPYSFDGRAIRNGYTLENVPEKIVWYFNVYKDGSAFPNVDRVFADKHSGEAKGAEPLSLGRVKVPEGQTPLNDKLGHRLLDVFNEGIKARDAGTGSPYHGHSLEGCIHAAGWVQRDLRLALNSAHAALRALAGDGRRRQMKALIVGGPNRGQVVDIEVTPASVLELVEVCDRVRGESFWFKVEADVQDKHEYVMRELCRAYEYLMKGETHRQHIKKNGKL